MSYAWRFLTVLTTPVNEFRVRKEQVCFKYVIQLLGGKFKYTELQAMLMESEKITQPCVDSHTFILHSHCTAQKKKN